MIGVERVEKRVGRRRMMRVAFPVLVHGFRAMRTHFIPLVFSVHPGYSLMLAYPFVPGSEIGGVHFVSLHPGKTPTLRAVKILAAFVGLCPGKTPTLAHLFGPTLWAVQVFTSLLAVRRGGTVHPGAFRFCRRVFLGLTRGTM